jgi:hypothetical protein
MNISKAKLALAAVFVVGSVTMASAQYMYAAPYGYYQGATRYNVPQEQLHWYDRNAVGQNV